MNKLFFNEKRYGNWILGSGDPKRINKIVELTGSHKVVLDIGCGIGEIGSRVKENNNIVYGIDISENAIKKAIRKSIVGKQCDIEKEGIPFKQIKFDTIVAAEIIEHIFDTDDFLQKIHSRLKKNGELILTTPNIATLGRRLMLFFGKNPLIEVNTRKYTAGHIRYFVKDSLFELLQSNGFMITLFTSDIVNFNNIGTLNSRVLAELFPTLGKTLIIKAVKI